jgi:hypothetical protein
MDSLQEAILARFKVEKQKGGINSPFGEAIRNVMETIPDQKWTFGRWCGYLRNIPVYEINSMLASAKKNKNVGRMFNYLIKEYKHEKGAR